MKISTKILSFAALAMLALAPSSRAADNDNAPAGPPPGRLERMREHRLQRLDETLHLTADQKTQITAIWDKAGEQGRALRKDESLSKEDRRAKWRELMQATHRQVRAVLTPDQQKAFDAMPVGRRDDRR